MRKVIAALVALGLVTALAVSPGAGQKMLNSKAKDDQPKKKSSEDKDYKAAVDRLPDQKFDPWRNMR
jgi:hypothetical protein